MNFTRRSDQFELLDQPDIPAVDIQRNLYELAIINRWLGGHRITCKGFLTLAKNKKDLQICEIGCGGGDNLKAIEKKAGNQFGHLHFTGIDMNAECIHVAEKLKWFRQPKFLISDFSKVFFPDKPDIIFCSLFCHHFRNEELVQMFKWLYENSVAGFFINDLQRHPLAYHSIHFLTRVFSRSYLVRNDAPLSVLRGFKKKELKDLLNKAGILQYTIHWHWAFRWLVIAKK